MGQNRWCSHLGFPSKDRVSVAHVAAARYIIDAAKTKLHLLEGKAPQTVAATAIYLMSLVSDRKVPFDSK